MRQAILSQGVCSLLSRKGSGRSDLSNLHKVAPTPPSAVGPIILADALPTDDD